MRIAAAVAFWVAAYLVQTFNWGAGIEKAVVLVALLAAIPFLLRAARRAPLAERPGLRRSLAILVALLIVVELGFCARSLHHPRIIDVATTTLAAGRAMLAGNNPYSLPIDTVTAANPATAAFAGYKYLPVMPMVFLPLGLPFGARGLIATNLLLQLGLVLLLAQAGRQAANATTGAIAAALYLAVPLVTQQVLLKGATDLAAVLPLLGALLLFGRRDFFAGLLVGLSIAMKPVPGGLFLPCLLPAAPPERWRYVAGVVVGLLPILPFALGAPGAFFDNAVLFIALRPPDSTSWLAVAPAGFALAARTATAVAWLAVAVRVWRRPPALPGRAALGAALTLAAILSGPSAHHNYQLWWLPFYCLLLGRALVAAVPKDLPRAGDPVYVSPRRG